MSRSTKLLAFLMITALMLSGIFLGLPMMMNRVMADSYSSELPFEDTKDEPLLTSMPNPARLKEAEWYPVPTLPPQLTPVPEAQPTGSTLFVATQPPDPQKSVKPEVYPTPFFTQALWGGLPVLDDLQPANWRILLQEEKEDILSQYHEARERAERELVLAPYSMEQARFSTYYSEMLLVENLEPQNLVTQKLRQGLLDNLLLDPVYVPGAEVLEHIMKQPQTSILLSKDGGTALFMITQDQLIPLALLQEANQRGYSSLSAEEAWGIMGGLFARAQQAVNAQPEIAMESSRQLISQMMAGDMPWELTIIRMEPFASERGWEYLAGGHHILCVDMKTGSLFTVTTDLLQNKVIGIATENMSPFLGTYAKWVDQSVGKGSASLVDEKGDAILDYASGLIDAFSNKKLSSAELKMEATVSFQYAREWQKGYWQVDYQPVNHEQILLDPKGSVFFTYSLELEEDLSLRSYTAFPAGGYTSSTYPLETVKISSEGDRAIIENIEDNAISITEMALIRLSDFWQPVSLSEQPEAYFRMIKPDKGGTILQAYLSVKVSDEQGRVYLAEAGLEEGNSLIIYSITREYEIPPDAVELQN